jgi:Domain of unknown function (DUF4304)
MDAHKRFLEIIKRDFAPVLRASGFKGSGKEFRRINGDVFHALSLQSHGGRACVNLGLHYSFLPTAGGSKTPIAKMKHYHCMFRDRLQGPDGYERWWNHGKTDAEAEASVADIVDTFRKRGEKFFRKFEPFPDVFEKITPAELYAGKMTKLPVRMTPLSAAVILARIMKHLKRPKECRAFAEVGLRHIEGGPAYKKTLERLRDIH